MVSVVVLLLKDNVECMTLFVVFYYFLSVTKYFDYEFIIRISIYPTFVIAVLFSVTVAVF